MLCDITRPVLCHAHGLKIKNMYSLNVSFSFSISFSVPALLIQNNKPVLCVLLGFEVSFRVLNVNNGNTFSFKRCTETWKMYVIILEQNSDTQVLL